MDTSPFYIHGPLPPMAVTGRDALITDIIDRVTGRRVTALVGPRRYGKTSVLRRVAAELGEVATIHVDLWGSTSPADVARAFEDGINAAPEAFRTPAAKTAITFGISLGAIKLSVARPASERPDYEALLPSLLAVITDTSATIPTLLVVDELSAAQRVPGTLAKMRTALQHHYSDLGILFAGSEPSTMAMLFASRDQPFYNQADIVRIDPLSTAASATIIVEGFSATNRDAGLTPTLAIDLTGGHPHRLMQVADAVWRATPVKGSVGPSEWTEGIDRLRLELSDGLQRYYGAQPMGHQRVLRLVAHGLSPHGTKASIIDLTPGAATRSRNALLDVGDLSHVGDVLCVTDPLLADWIRLALPL